MATGSDAVEASLSQHRKKHLLDQLVLGALVQVGGELRAPGTFSGR
jgi:hypothetical protein